MRSHREHKILNARIKSSRPLAGKTNKQHTAYEPKLVAEKITQNKNIRSSGKKRLMCSSPTEAVLTNLNVCFALGWIAVLMSLAATQVNICGILWRSTTARCLPTPREVVSRGMMEAVLNANWCFELSAVQFGCSTLLKLWRAGFGILFQSSYGRGSDPRSTGRQKAPRVQTGPSF